jgi:hypothetical protein
MQATTLNPELTTGPTHPINGAPLAQPERVDLEKWGYARSGAHSGSLQGMRACLDLIHQGHIVDQNQDLRKQEAYKETIRQKITEADKKILEAHQGKRTLEEVRIPEKEALLKRKEGEKSAHEIAFAQGLENTEYDRLLVRFLGALLGASFLFVVFYYTSALYTALSYNPGEALDNINDNGDLKDVFATIFKVESLLREPWWILASAIFIGMATIIHIKAKSASKWFYALYVLPLAIDVMLALQIESNLNLAREMVGLEQEPPYGKVFWLVFLLAFTSYLAFSWLFDLYRKEKKKKSPRLVFEAKLQQILHELEAIRNELAELRAEIIQLDGHIQGLERDKLHLEEDLNKTQSSKSDLRKAMASFLNGWLAFLDGLDNNGQRRVETQDAFQQYLNEHQLLTNA